MTTLARYVIRRHLFLLAICQVLSAALYMLIYTVERVDEFTDSGQPLSVILMHLGTHMPGMITLVLPGVFLLAMVLQLGLMRRSRELTVLQAGGISPKRLTVLLFVYSLVWAGLHFAFSEVVATPCNSISMRIWREEIKGKNKRVREVRDTWLKRGNVLLNMDRVLPEKRTAYGVTIYHLGDDGLEVTRVITAGQAVSDGGDWQLHGVEISGIKDFTFQELDEYRVHTGLNLAELAAVSHGQNPKYIPAWDLLKQVRELQTSGADVRRLLAVLHGKVAYSMIIPVMTLASVVIVAMLPNVYTAVLAGLVVVFAMFNLNAVGETLGSMGALPPWLGAWLGNLLVGGVALLRLSTKDTPV